MQKDMPQSHEHALWFNFYGKKKKKNVSSGYSLPNRKNDLEEKPELAMLLHDTETHQSKIKKPTFDSATLRNLTCTEKIFQLYIILNYIKYKWF